jgi:hypothetical protein
MHYVKTKNVKEFYKSRGKQVSKELLLSLDIIINEILEATCRTWNGNHKRIDASLIPTKYKKG